MANEGPIAKDTLFEPKRHRARAIDRDRGDRMGSARSRLRLSTDSLPLRGPALTSSGRAATVFANAVAHEIVGSKVLLKGDAWPCAVGEDNGFAGDALGQDGLKGICERSSTMIARAFLLVRVLLGLSRPMEVSSTSTVLPPEPKDSLARPDMRRRKPPAGT